MLSSISNLLLLLFLFLLSTIPFTISQPSTPTPEAQPPAASSCNEIFLSYIYEGGTQIKPTDPTNQPYRFQSTLTIQNNGRDELKSWKVFVGFQNEELLVSASNAILADGTTLPAAVGNGTVFAGYPMTDLKTAIETAGDDTQTTVQIKLLGTQFNVPLKNVPWPSNISLANDGFVCPDATKEGNVMYVCCKRDPKFKSNISVDEEFLPRQNGDLTIMYDVIRTYDSSYWAEVTIANHNPLGRLDNWKLSWDWMNDEFIYSMKGAYPYVVDSTDCIYGPQGTYYKDLDFANVLNCERRPTIIDLPPTLANDTTLGMIPSCCRNGTILPTTMDPRKSTSAFQLQVYKMPPALNRSALTPPQNWKINGTLNPDYQCGPPVRVSPSQFPTGLPSNKTAFASWQVVCNITHSKGERPRCCVSFSAYYNDSVIPCSTCACGCPSNTARTCSATAPAILLPPQALLVPFENRTAMAVAWADLKHRAVPKPLPCADNCGVSINWHLYTDYSRGWSARITVFNWQDTAFSDWFAAVQLDKATAGFEAMYSFNGSTLVVDGANNTLFMQGLPGLNYLVGETDGANPNKDPRVPGKQQTVISFTKKTTPRINVAAGDGFPTKVFFNGEECSLPSVYPTSNSSKKGSGVILSILLAAMVFMLMQR